MGTSAAIVEELTRLERTGPVVIVGTCDAALVPALSRGWGVRVTPARDAVDVCLYAASGRQVLANLAEHPHAAVNITSPTTYRSLQVKGRVQLAGADAEDSRRVADHQRAFVEAVATVGLPEELAVRLFADERRGSSAMTRIRVFLDTVFDQTPGPGAGARL